LELGGGGARCGVHDVADVGGEELGGVLRVGVGGAVPVMGAVLRGEGVIRVVRLVMWLVAGQRVGFSCSLVGC
jgi:hypothetical protein